MSPAGAPALPDQLLVPLMETAAEVLQSRDPGDVPPTLRPLAGFARAGLRTPAARQQLRKAFDAGGDFADAVTEEFGARPEVQAALEAWDAGTAVRAVAEATERADLPLLASALYTTRPDGWEFGLGVAAAFVDRQRVEQEEEQEDRLRASELAALEEALRRAEETRDSALNEVTKLQSHLREERHARRGREREAETQAEEAAKRADDAEKALARARVLQETAEKRIGRETDRTRAVEEDLRAARGALAESEQARRDIEAELEASGKAGLRRADVDALVDAAELARRLADGLGGVAEHVRRPAPREPAPIEPPPLPPERTDRPRRTRPSVPPGMMADSPDALVAMLRTRGVVLVVDGYNVSMAGWGGASVTDQRTYLADALARLHARTRCDVIVVFDGADVDAVRGLRHPGIRVFFSDPGETADKVIVRTVGGLAPHRAAVVASSDRWVQDHAAEEGAQPVAADTLLAVLRS